MGDSPHGLYNVPVIRTPNYHTDLTAALAALEAALMGEGTLLSGLQLEWVSTTSIKVKKGFASIPDGGLVTVESDITVTGLGVALGASAWGHAYLYDDDGDPAVEVVTTAPVNYFGTAYQKTSNATRRYLGSVRTNASSQTLKFQHVTAGNRIRYQEHLAGSPFRVLNAGTATTETSVPADTVIPVTSRFGDFRVTNTATNAAAITLGNADDNITIPASWLMTSAPNDDAPGELTISTAQALTYAYTVAPTGGAAYIDVAGYWFER